MEHFKVWAPNAQSVELVTRDKQSFQPSIRLEKTTQTYRGKALPGYWQVPAHGLQNLPLRDGDGYWLRIVLDNGETRYRVDPYARAMQHSESYSIHKDPARFPWTDAQHRPTARGKMVIYQLFQGGYVGRGDGSWTDPAGNNYHFTWDQKRKGDFPQLRKKLDYIQALGVNTIELLPINEFSGDNYIGYSPVSFFAVESSYGGVIGDGSSYDDLKAFINDAHSRGISVIADIVLNHFGAAGNSGPLWNFDSTTTNIYFSGEQASNQAGGTFGMAPNWARYEVQKYIEDACHYYLAELHFDGLRFDFTSQIVNKNSGSGDDSGSNVLRRLIAGLKNADPEKTLMCEHWDEYTGSYSRWMMEHIGFDAGWFNFRKELQTTLKPYQQGVEGALAHAINGGDYTHAHSRVVYANNHDECWWDGGQNQDKFYPVTQFGWRGDYWAQKKSRMMYALAFFVPGVPLFFMGDEFAMEGNFNDARKDHILNWDLERLPPGPQFKAMFQRLIEIRQSYDPLTREGTSFEWLHYPQDGWFAFKRKWEAAVLVVAGNWTGEDKYHYGVPTNGETGRWTQIFNSDSTHFGGDGVGNYLNDPNSNDASMTINIPKQGIVVMARTSI
ncbi:alpha-amylase family glycosyl hydrolase [Candidatus Accumulibacter sp. ACC003]|uniref:alpha-amylase family glycosyl hydrolase n=1 Tax=Candidatus Accumulibacter sp. ACC003 TaxID=2823334 RepID=UPI0025BD329E|nr:alpha-amylase family glycosyl hydrolase [Candidatus Accumulibacter sp. ACC003]